MYSLFKPIVSLVSNLTTKAESDFQIKFELALQAVGQNYGPRNTLLLLLDLYEQESPPLQEGTVTTTSAPYLVIVRDLKELFFYKTDAEFAEAIEVLNTLPFHNDSRFMTILSAFYSVYLNYFHQLTNPRLKANIILSTFDNLVFNDLLVNAKRQSLRPRDIFSYKLPLIQLTQTQESFITGVFKPPAEPAVYDNSVLLEKLALLTPIASDWQIEDSILPLALNLSAEQEPSHLKDIYQIINAASSRVSLDTLTEIILPQLEKNLENKKSGANSNICETLTVIAKRLSPNEVDTLVVPLLIKISHSEIPYFKKSAYNALADILDLISANTVQAEIYPILLRDLKEKYISRENEFLFSYLHKINFDTMKKNLSVFYYKLLEYLAKHSQDMQVQNHLPVSIEEISTEINTQYSAALKELKDTPFPQWTLDKLRAVTQHASALNNNDLTTAVIPLLIQGISHSVKDIVKECFATLRLLADLNTLTRANKQMILRELPKSLSKREKAKDEAIEALTSYLKFTDDTALLVQLITQAMQVASFTDRYNNLNNDLALIQLLTEIFKIIPANLIPTTMPLYFLEGLKDFQHGIVKEIVECATALFLRLDLDVMKKEIFPKLIQKFEADFYNRLTPLILTFLPKFNYDERIYWMYFFLKKSADVFAKHKYEPLLVCLCDLNRREINSQHEVQLDIHEEKAVSQTRMLM